MNPPKVRTNPYNIYNIIYPRAQPPAKVVSTAGRDNRLATPQRVRSRPQSACDGPTRGNEYGALAFRIRNFGGGYIIIIVIGKSRADDRATVPTHDGKRIIVVRTPSHSLRVVL